ncbi:hypothetical protein BLNAU_6545 [Blattamonas nauphoetae]|uniref:Cyclin N-terminal domain-containing protein n=1 Tax=Blattamonas nauphoetae TaxID=2049346 RepID=A0ABQ9Y440_9EUKA|nr:hypothetical protein BLNAU_6545 [Blattamonas nauphoetae]
MASIVSESNLSVFTNSFPAKHHEMKQTSHQEHHINGYTSCVKNIHHTELSRLYPTDTCFDSGRAEDGFGRRFRYSLVSLVYSQPKFSTSRHSCEVCDRLLQRAHFGGMEPVELISQEEFSYYLRKIVEVLLKTYRMTLTELVQAFWLFKEAIGHHWDCAGFTLIRNNLLTLIVVCCMVGHKLSNDHPVRNQHWSESFGVPLILVNEFESALLDQLHWKMSIGKEDYVALRDQLCVG